MADFWACNIHLHLPVFFRGTHSNFHWSGGRARACGGLRRELCYCWSRVWSYGARFCSLEFWYLMVIIVIAGHLDNNPVVPVDAISICMNINGWDAMISIGFNAAISVRVSNQLGAGNARAAKFSVVVVSITTLLIGVVCTSVVLATRDVFPYLFTSSDAVAKETTRLSVVLALTVLLNGLQPVLSGVAVGAGWQSIVAYINIGSYYIVGLPLGILLGFVFGFGAMGIWGGMIGGIVLQTLILIGITSTRNWDKEANEAESRVKRWGGAVASLME